MPTDNNYEALTSAVRDIMMKNQNLYQQAAEAEFNQYNQQTPQEVEAAVEKNVVDTPDPTADAEMVDPETVIPGSSGVADGEA